MTSIARREFLKAGMVAAGCLSGSALSLGAYDLGSPLGFQAHALGETLVKDFPGTLKKVASLGYQTVELVSFKGYVARGFGALATLKPAEIRTIVKDAGLSVNSSHFMFNEFTDQEIGGSVEWAKGVGLKYVVLTGTGGGRGQKADDGSTFAQLNRIGERLLRDGLQLAVHTTGDVPGIDSIIKNVSKNCVFQLCFSGVLNAGVDPADLLLSHRGWFFSVHLRDSKKPAESQGRGGGGGTLPVGQGDIDWKKALPAAKQSGVTSYLVEMQLPATPGGLDPMSALKISFDYIRDLKA